MQRIFTIIFSGLLFFQLINASAQNFSLVDPGFGKCHDPAAAWVDMDNDGDLDVFISGVGESNLPAFHIFRNEGGSTFIEFFPAITGVSHAACAFGDMNNDGLADLALMGDDGNSHITRVYRNDGDFVFININAGIIGLSSGSLAWADYDRDGFADLLVSGLDNDGFPLTRLYRNNDGAGFSDAGYIFSGLYESSLAWYDLNGDQYLDFAICGRDSLNQARTYIYKQSGDDFVKMDAGIMGLWGGELDWGDYNSDGYADLVISGTDSTNASQTLVYKNNGGVSFTLLAGPFDGVSSGSSFWGDFDNNGSLDLVVAGRANSILVPPPPPEDPFLKIYLNQGGDSFIGQLVDLPAPDKNSIARGDYDNDSDLDLLLTGSMVNPIGGSSDHCLIYKNETTNINNPPSAPEGLDYEVAGNDIILEWIGKADDHTPLAGLNYNLRLGTQSGNMDFLSALALLPGGYRRIVESGNASSNTTHTLSGLPFGEYYASVQSIDHSFAGSPFSDNLFIVFLPTATFSVDDTVCTDDLTTVTYTGNASPAAQYIWDFDGAFVLSGSGQGPYVLYWETPGLKTVSLTVIENGMTSVPVSKDVLAVRPVLTAGTITGETEFCQGTASGEYIVSPIAGAVNYIWEILPAEAGTINGTGMVVEIFWDDAFAGMVSLTVSGNNYCGPGPVSEPLEINILPRPGKPSAPEGPTELCRNPANSLYTTAGAANGLSYSWELFPAGAGSIENNGLQATVNWENSFTGGARLVVTSLNTCGQGPASDTLNINIALPPAADAGTDQVIEYLNSTQLSGTASGGSGSYTYYWTPADLLVDPAVIDPQTLPLSFSVQFTLFVTDEESGCTGQDQVIVTVIGGPLSVEASAEPAEVCVGGEVQLLALPSGGSGVYTYTWTSEPPGFSSSIANPIVYPETTTTYFIELTDGDDEATDSVEVTVLSLPDAAGEIIGPDEVCAGDNNVIYSVEAVPDATHYQWILSDGLFGNSNTSSIAVSFADPPSGTTGSIMVKPLNDCGAGTASEMNVFINETPLPPSGIIGPDSLCTTTDTIVAFMVDGSPAETAYEWKILPEEAGVMSGTGPSADAHFNKNWEGEAIIIARALNDCGYSGWSEPLPVTAYTCVGIFEPGRSQAEVLIYPNPAKDLLYVSINSGSKQSIIGIYDLYGRLMETAELPGGESMLQMNVSGFPPGLYFIKITGDRGASLTARFIISR